MGRDGGGPCRRMGGDARKQQGAHGAPCCPVAAAPPLSPSSLHALQQQHPLLIPFTVPASPISPHTAASPHLPIPTQRTRNAPRRSSHSPPTPAPCVCSDTLSGSPEGRTLLNTRMRSVVDGFADGTLWHRSEREGELPHSRPPIHDLPVTLVLASNLLCYWAITKTANRGG